MIGAYYYLWYGGLGDWSLGYTGHPILGEYNSRDAKVISQHTAWVEEAGIDFLAISWYNPNNWEDITLRDYYLPAIKNSKIKFCIHYESILALDKSYPKSIGIDFNHKYSNNKSKGQKFLEDFEYLAETYFNHPQYLKINNCPVVIIYVARDFWNAKDYLAKLKINMAKRGIQLFLIADIITWTNINISLKSFLTLRKIPLTKMKSFFQRRYGFFSEKSSAVHQYIDFNKYINGITGYNMYRTNRINNFLKDVDYEYQKFREYANLNKLWFIPAIMPGYDDRNKKGLKRPILERKKGKFYKDFWEIAKKYVDPSLRLVLITTFNEWFEGTAIEPSKEYSDAYLKLTNFLTKGLEK